MGLCTSSTSAEPDGDMVGAGSYKNLNPLMSSQLLYCRALEAFEERERSLGADHYLARRLFPPYFVNAQGVIKRPEHLIAFWNRIFSFLRPSPFENLRLRWMCRMFRDALPSSFSPTSIEGGTFSIFLEDVSYALKHCRASYYSSKRYHFRSFTTVVLPNSLKTIEDKTFLGCRSLLSVELPDALESIGCEAFRGCSSLTYVRLPDSLVCIGNNAFLGCTSLASVSVPHIASMMFRTDNCGFRPHRTGFNEFGKLVPSGCIIFARPKNDTPKIQTTGRTRVEYSSGYSSGYSSSVSRESDCIASPTPATFGSQHFLSTPGGQFLKKSYNHSEWKQDGSSLALSLGGKRALTHDALPSWNVCSGLDEKQRHALMTFIDARYKKEEEQTNDFRITLSRQELSSTIGESSTKQLEHNFKSEYNTIRMRRVAASGKNAQGECVAFHTDFSRRTMQVVLNDAHEYDGGLLIFATSNGFSVPKRMAGSFTIHNYKSVHGVTALTRGVRYSLFLCRTTATEEEEDTALAVHEEVALVSKLNQQVGMELDFFERAVAVLKHMDDEGIASIIANEYPTWFEENEENTVYPSLAMEIVSKVHMLRPLVFATALSTHCVAATSLNTLVIDVRKQQLFMEKVLDTALDVDAENTVLDYMKFLRVSGGLCGGGNQEGREPPLLVDLVWHVHMQLFRGGVYGADCVRIAGRFVDHKF